jgi:hypothetical protein
VTRYYVECMFQVSDGTVCVLAVFIMLQYVAQYVAPHNIMLYSAGSKRASENKM